MKISLSRDNILKPLQHVAGVVERKQNSPILSNLLVKVEKNHLTLTGTDSEVEMIINIPVESNEQGETTLPAKKFLDICRTLPDGATININIDGNKAVIRSGKSRFTLSTLPAAEFPQNDALNVSQEISLKQAIFKKLIDQVQFSMAQQDVRYYLNGLMLEIAPQHIVTVATDGHRLAISKEILDTGINEKRQIIIPRKGVSELSKLLEDTDEMVTLQLGDNLIKVTLGAITFSSKLIDGKFPDYNQVLPVDNNAILECSRDVLKQAFSRTSVLSNEKYRGMRLSLSANMLNATINNPDQEEAEEEIEVNYSGDEFEIGFNVAYFLDVLNTIKDDDVIIKFKDSNSSCLIQAKNDDNTRYVIMPMRL